MVTVAGPNLCNTAGELMRQSSESPYNNMAVMLARRSEDAGPLISSTLETSRRKISSLLAVPPMFFLFFGYLCHVLVLNRVILMRTCDAMFGAPCSDLPQEEINEASAKAGVVFSGVMSSFAALSLVSTSWLGAASDVIGRRPILLASSMLLCLASVGTYLVLQQNWSLTWLIPIHAVAGFSGTFTSWNAAIFAFTADVSAPETLPNRFAILEGSIFAGAAIGPLVGTVSYAAARTLH